MKKTSNVHRTELLKYSHMGVAQLLWTHWTLDRGINRNQFSSFLFFAPFPMYIFNSQNRRTQILFIWSFLVFFCFDKHSHRTYNGWSDTQRILLIFSFNCLQCNAMYSSDFWMVTWKPLICVLVLGMSLNDSENSSPKFIDVNLFLI